MYVGRRFFIAHARLGTKKGLQSFSPFTSIFCLIFIPITSPLYLFFYLSLEHFSHSTLLYKIPVIALIYFFFRSLVERSASRLPRACLVSRTPAEQRHAAADLVPSSLVGGLVVRPLSMKPVPAGQGAISMPVRPTLSLVDSG